jgi:hypothetical protein
VLAPPELEAVVKPPVPPAPEPLELALDALVLPELELAGKPPVPPAPELLELALPALVLVELPPSGATAHTPLRQYPVSHWVLAVQPPPWPQ